MCNNFLSLAVVSCFRQGVLHSVGLPNTACTRTAGFSPPKWLFRGFGFCPFRGRVSSRQPPVTRAVGPQAQFCFSRKIMADTIAGILGFTAFVLLILSGLADIILSATWTKWYFTSGVRVFNLLIPIESRHATTPSASLLNKKLHSFWMGGFIFKEIEVNNYAFRRKFFAFAPNPILHGLVKFDTENNLIVVNGYLGWFSVSFSIMWLVLVPLATLIAGYHFYRSSTSCRWLCRILLLDRWYSLYNGLLSAQKDRYSFG